MDAIILDNIPFEIDAGGLLHRLRIEPGGEDAATIKQMVEDATAVARPRGIFGVAYVESRSDESIVIDGVAFTSRVLRVNLDEAGRVFPYLSTCGMELQVWSDTFGDVFQRYWADAVKDAALGCANRAVRDHMAERYRPGRTSFMAPGSLADWPISEQKQLFDLLGNPPESIGVQLTDSFLMIPTKSVSGICFPTEWDYDSCRLCPRDACPSRRAPYDKDLYERKYR